MNKIARYQVIEKIGQGGMGVVYKVHDPVLNKFFALKVLKLDNPSDSVWIRFQKEAKTLCELRHPSIPEIYNFDLTEEDEPYMVMELIEGKSLKDLLKEEGILSIEVTREIVLQICDSLAHAHSRHLLHRDIKPDNIILCGYPDSTRVKLVDFGMAKLIDERSQDMTVTGCIIGTPPYMSPEQIKCEDLDERSDIYSLGCVLFEMLTGVPPFLEETPLKTITSHCSLPPPTLKEKNPQIDYFPEIEKIISKVLSKEKESRYQNVAKLKQALLRLSKKDLRESHSSLNRNLNRETDEEKEKPALPLKSTIFVTLITISFISFIIWNLNKDSEQDLKQAIKQAQDQVQDQKEETEKQSRESKERISSNVIFENRIQEISERKFLKNVKGSTLFKNNNCKGSVYYHKEGLALKVVAEPTFNDQNLENLVNSEEFKGIPQIWNLTDSKITGSNFDKLSQQEFIELNLNNTAISDTSLKDLKNTKLETLMLNATSITDRAIEHVSQIENLKELKLLFCNRITNRGIKFLASMKRLELLAVSGNHINDSSIAIISDSKSIRRLRLPQRKLTESSLRPLMKMPSLTDLGLYNCNLAKSAVNTLTNFKKLRRLGVADTNLTKVDLRLLRSSLPECDVDSETGKRGTPPPS